MILKKGQKLFQEGEPVTGVFFLTEGVARVHKRWTEGRELVLRFAGPGDMLGYMGLGERKTYPLSAAMLGDGLVCYFDIKFFDLSLQANNSLALYFVRFFAKELQQYELRMQDLVHMPVKGRIAQALLAVQEKFGTGDDGFISFQPSRQHLSAFAGVVYETFFKISQEFVRDGLIELDAKCIRLLNIQKLEILAGRTLPGA